MYMIYWIISKFNILTHHIQPFNLKKLRGIMKYF